MTEAIESTGLHRRFQHPCETGAALCDDELRGICEALSAGLKFRSVVLSDCFRDSDKVNSGRISTAAFRRSLPADLAKPPLSEKQVTYLMDTLTDPAAKVVSYRNLCVLVDACSSSNTKVVPKTTLPVPLARLMPFTHILKHKLKNLDIAKNGTCSAADAEAVIRSAQPQLFSTEEMAALITLYRHTDDAFFYDKFLEDLENITNLRQKGENTSDSTFYEDESKDPLLFALSQSERKSKLSEAQEKISLLIKQKRLHIIPFFEDFDKKNTTSHTGKVSFHQAARVLGNCFPFLDEQDISLLCHQFKTPPTPEKPPSFDYAAFCRTLDYDFQ